MALNILRLLSSQPLDFTKGIGLTKDLNSNQAFTVLQHRPCPVVELSLTLGIRNKNKPFPTTELLLFPRLDKHPWMTIRGPRANAS